MISGSQQERIRKYSMMRSQNPTFNSESLDQQIGQRRGHFGQNLQTSSIPDAKFDHHQLNRSLQNLRNLSPQAYQILLENNYRAMLANRSPCPPSLPQRSGNIPAENHFGSSMHFDTDLAHQFSLLMRKDELNHPSFPTPSASESNSRSTVTSGWGNELSEISQFTSRDFVARKGIEKNDVYRNNSSYASPSYSFESVTGSGREDYDRLMRESNFDPRNSSFQSQNLAAQPSGVYTSDTVHHLVKSNRDPKQHRVVSNKVFVGGINHLMDRAIINQFFGQFGIVFVDWPVKAPKMNVRGKPGPVSSYSYLFLVYVDEESVHRLMNSCISPNGNDFYVCIPGCHDKRIQIRPWFLEKGFYFHPEATFREVIDIHRTVFVGGLPRIVTAEEISTIFSVFGNVLLVNIDLDQDYGYPKGAARVTFEKDSAFNLALEKKYIKFDSIDSSKTTIEIKPYVMEDVACDQCGGLWFNPILEIYSHLENSSKTMKDTASGRRNPIQDSIFSNETKSENSDRFGHFDMWSYNGPLSPLSPSTKPQESGSFFDKIDGRMNNKNDMKTTVENERKNEVEIDHFRSPSCDSESDTEKLYKGSIDFYQIAKKFNLHKPKTWKFNGKEYSIGPNLWGLVIAEPNTCALSQDIMQIPTIAQIDGHLQMRRNANIYCNKSSYCKDKPCRQYYCSSCSHKLHSMKASTRQHSILPAGKPNRRPRRDKSMYLIDQ